MSAPRFKKDLTEMVCAAGEILLGYFGRVTNVRQKESPSSVVSDADLAAEAHIVRHIRRRFPDDSIIAEESGYTQGSSAYTWVIDPLDGTSNFVAAIPWFGVMVGVLRAGLPVAAAIYVPTERALYYAEKGAVVSRNGHPIHLTSETKLSNVLCAFGFDPGANPRRTRSNLELLRRVSAGVRNTRATNSLIDFCYTLEGRLGGCINLNCKIWDIVPVALMLPEAGGKITDLKGNPLRFVLNDLSHSYGMVGASRVLHRQLLALLNP
jgi:myo-inositol-1(or 4)-monophosphatase